jgi:DNA-binding phage protein
MLTSDDLAAQLVGLDLDAVATKAKVSKKTLQRFLAKKNEPKLDTANRVFAAIASLKRKAARA